MKTNKTPVKLTPALLRSIIEEEVKKGFGDMEDAEKRAKDTDEVDADEHGTDKALEKHIDYVKALKVEEKRLVRRLSRVQEAKKQAARALVSKI
jgi:hypothetical protein